MRPPSLPAWDQVLLIIAQCAAPWRRTAEGPCSLPPLSPLSLLAANPEVQPNPQTSERGEKQRANQRSVLAPTKRLKMLVCHPISLLPETTSRVFLCIWAQSPRSLQKSQCAPAGRKTCTPSAVPSRTMNLIPNNEHQPRGPLGWAANPAAV